MLRTTKKVFFLDYDTYMKYSILIEGNLLLRYQYKKSGTVKVKEGLNICHKVGCVFFKIFPKTSNKTSLLFILKVYMIYFCYRTFFALCRRKIQCL